MNLEQLIQDNVDKLSPTDWVIYETLKSVSSEQLTLKFFSEQCHVSSTTVFRFCKKLGLEGFSELKSLLKYEVKEVSNFQENIAYHYHEILDFIKDYQIENLFKHLTNASEVYILARSEQELRIAKEAQRIFVQNQVLVYILSTDESLTTRWSRLTQAFLLVIHIDSDKPFPSVLHSPIDNSTCYRVLLSAIKTPQIVAHDYFLFPQLLRNSITPFILALEIIYLKWITEQ